MWLHKQMSLLLLFLHRWVCAKGPRAVRALCLWQRDDHTRVCLNAEKISCLHDFRQESWRVDWYFCHLLRSDRAIFRAFYARRWDIQLLLKVYWWCDKHHFNFLVSDPWYFLESFFCWFWFVGRQQGFRNNRQLHRYYSNLHLLVDWRPSSLLREIILCRHLYRCRCNTERNRWLRKWLLMVKNLEI